jgi:hypothetical protein
MPDDLYLWQVCYIDALCEADPSRKPCRIYEALAAIEQRLLSPVEPHSNEELALKVATVGLARLRAERMKVRTSTSRDLFALDLQVPIPYPGHAGRE